MSLIVRSVKFKATNQQTDQINLLVVYRVFTPNVLIRQKSQNILGLVLVLSAHRTQNVFRKVVGKLISQLEPMSANQAEVPQ